MQFDIVTFVTDGPPRTASSETGCQCVSYVYAESGWQELLMYLYSNELEYQLHSLKFAVYAAIIKIPCANLCKLAYAHKISTEQYFNVCIINVDHIQLDQNQHCINNEDLNQLKRKSVTDIQHILHISVKSFFSPCDPKHQSRS